MHAGNKNGLTVIGVWYHFLIRAVTPEIMLKSVYLDSKGAWNGTAVIGMLPEMNCNLGLLEAHSESAYVAGRTAYFSFSHITSLESLKERLSKLRLFREVSLSPFHPSLQK